MQNDSIEQISPLTVIIDYELGNLFSVKQACNHTGINAIVSSDPEIINRADGLILPGVGAFAEAMKNIERLGLLNPIIEKAKSKTPFFGICLGQQLLFSESEEFVNCKGLDLIKGTIKKFPSVFQEKKIKVPQIGWNRVYEVDHFKRKDSPLSQIDDGEFMYFVHSYFTIPADSDVVLTKTNYCGIEYCSSLMQDNIFSTQFHPEKSAEKGLSIYRTWAITNNLIKI